jgi:7-cyano-7-deazaguanine synthase in queuosine biosynthesis
MKIIGHFSGGFDSVAACILELEQGHKVHGQYIDYGHKYSNREQEAALKISEILETKFSNWLGVTTMRSPLWCESSTKVEFYVPVRNLVLVSLSIQTAVAFGYDAVSVGMRTLKRRPDDPNCFRDASIPFIALMQAVVNEVCEDGASVELRMPLVERRGIVDKVQCMRKIQEYGIDLNLIWNCYGGGPERCGSCLHCKEFEENLATLQCENLGTI